MLIQINPGENTSNIPSAVMAAFNYTAQLMDAIFTNNVTIDVNLNFGPTGGIFGNNLSNGGLQPVDEPFSVVQAALLAHAQTPQLANIYKALGTSDFLPTAAPAGSPAANDVAVAPAEAEALGLPGVSGPVNIDLTVNNASNLSYAFSPGYVPWGDGDKDPIDGMFHEITETAMGRIGVVGGGGLYSVADLFRFTSAGGTPARDLTSGTSASNGTAYFSVDKGTTNLGTWNNIPDGYDLDDWTTNPGGAQADSFGGATDGMVNPVSPTDILLMNVLGWQLNTGHTVEITKGQTSAGLFVVGSAGQLIVDSGGVADSATYTAAGNGLVFGLDSGAMVFANGTETVFGGGVASGTLVGNGGAQVVAGGTAVSTTVSISGKQTVEYGGFLFQTPHAGVSSDTKILGGIEEVASGGSAHATQVIGLPDLVYSPATSSLLVVDAGGFATGTVISTGGVENVSGSDSNVVIEGGGTQSISFGGTASSAFVNGGLQEVFGTAVSAVVGSATTGLVPPDKPGATPPPNPAGVPGSQTIGGGGVAIDTRVNAGGVEQVNPNGLASATSVYQGGEEAIHGGTASGSIVSSGGSVGINAGSAVDTTLYSGGAQGVTGTGIANSTIVSSGGAETVGEAGPGFQGVQGTTFATVVSKGGYEYVYSGGIASGTIVDTGGAEWIYQDGLAVSAAISNGGTQEVYTGAVAKGTIINSGGIQNVSPGGTASDTVLSAGGVLNVYSGATVTGTEFRAGTEYVLSGAIVSGEDDVNGTQWISSGGSASNTTVDGGSLEYVDSGGTLSGATIKGESGLTVVGFASAVVLSSSMQTVFGVAHGTTIEGTNGREYVEAGGVESGATLKGGVLDVLNGGTLSGTTTISGGTLELAVGGAIDGPIKFAGNGTLEINGTSMPAATISGFAAADVIDLAGVSYVAGASTKVVAGNVLQVTVGGASYDLQLETDVSYAGDSFTVFSEQSQAGTFVTIGPAPLTGNNNVGNGQTVHNKVIVDGGTMTVEPGGTAQATVIDSGGLVTVSSGGNADGSIINDGGNQVILAGGTASGTMAMDPGIETVSSGGVSISATLEGGEQYVSSGGSALGTTVDSASDQYVYAGGTASNTTVEAGGVQIVSGSATSTTLSGTFATQFVYGSATATTIGFESYDYVETGGADSSTIVGSGGLDTIWAGGVTSASEVDSDGNQYIYGSAVATTIEAGGVQSVQSDGVATGTVINGSGDQYVYAGGTADNTTADFGVQVVYGGATSTTLSGSFATQFVYGAAAATTIGSGSFDYVESGGADSGTSVGSGGLDLIYFGGVTSGSEVGSGGTQQVYGLATGTTIDGGGVEDVESGGSASITAVGSVGFQWVLSAGTATGTTLDGGYQFVYGAASGTTINTAGYEYVESGGVDSGTLVASGGLDYVSAGGITDGSQVGSGGNQFVYGLASATTVDDDGVQNVQSGGGAACTMVNSFGFQYVSTGAVASGTTLSSGVQVVYGAASGTAVDGGSQDVYGTASGTVINGTASAGSYEYVEAGGAESGTTINGGGLELIYLGGTASGAAVSSGGEQDVLGLASGTIIESGGYQRVYSGGTADGTIFDSGGALQLDVGASLGSTVGFAGAGGTLRIEGMTMPQATIEGLVVGDVIDLAGVAYDSAGSATLGAGNLLQVSAGGQTYGLNLDPTQDFAGEGFVLSSGVFGETEVLLVQQPLNAAVTVSSGQTAFNEVVGSGGSIDVLPGGTIAGATVSSGGSIDVNGGTAVGVTVSDGGYQYVGSGGTSIDTLLTDPGVEIVAVGGSAFGATVSGGEQDVFGNAVGTTVYSGVQVVEAGGTVSGTTIFNGLETVSAGGLDSGAEIDGGEQDVFGSAVGATVSSGIQVVEFGGMASGTSIASGSTVGVLDGGRLQGGIANDGTLIFDIAGSASFGGTVAGGGTVTVAGGGDLDVLSSYTGAAEVDDTSTLEFARAYTGAVTFGGAATGPGGTLEFDAGSVGPITVVNPNDAVIAQPGSDNWIQSTVDYTLPTNIDTLFLYGGTQGTGNSDATGDALYAIDPTMAQTLTGNSAIDTFVVYNSADVVMPQAGSHDVVYAAASYTLPTGGDTLILEAGTQGVGNSDAAGDALYAANPNQVATLTGNSANDTFVVYNSADVVVPEAGSHDVVYSAVNYTLPTGVDSLILEAATEAVGNSDAAGDTLYAAYAGIAQTLTGNSQSDTFVVYNSADTVTAQAGSTDTVYAAADFTLPTNVDTLFLEGSSATHGTGNSDAFNALFGNAGLASTLVAGSGSDVLYVTGAAGTTLTGGAGADTFAFPNAMGNDEITNFSTAKDVLQFNASLFANFSAAMASATQSGANTVFTIDAHDSVTLDNVNKTSLTAANFRLT